METGVWGPRASRRPLSLQAGPLGGSPLEMRISAHSGGGRRSLNRGRRRPGTYSRSEGSTTSFGHLRCAPRGYVVLGSSRRRLEMAGCLALDRSRGGDAGPKGDTSAFSYQLTSLLRRKDLWLKLAWRRYSQGTRPQLSCELTAVRRWSSLEVLKSCLMLLFFHEIVSTRQVSSSSPGDPECLAVGASHGPDGDVGTLEAL